MRDDVWLWSVDRRCLMRFVIGGVGECEWVSVFTASVKLFSGGLSWFRSLDGERVRCDDADELCRESEPDDDDDRDSCRVEDFCWGRTITKRRDVG